MANKIYRKALFAGILLCLAVLFVVVSGSDSYAGTVGMYSYHYDTDKYCIRCKDVLIDADELVKQPSSSWEKLILKNAGVQVYVNDSRNGSDDEALKKLTFDCSKVKSKVTTSGFPVTIRLPGLSEDSGIPVQFKVFTYRITVIKKTILTPKRQIGDGKTAANPVMNTVNDTDGTDSVPVVTNTSGTARVSEPVSRSAGTAKKKKTKSAVKKTVVKKKKEPTVEVGSGVVKESVPLVTEEPLEKPALPDTIPRVGIPLSAILLLILILILLSDIKVLHWYRKRKQQYYEKGKQS